MRLHSTLRAPHAVMSLLSHSIKHPSNHMYMSSSVNYMYQQICVLYRVGYQVAGNYCMNRKYIPLDKSPPAVTGY